MSISLTVKASWAVIGWRLHWHRSRLAELRMNGHADNQWGQMRVSRVRYGTPHSWTLIKSYELSLMGMCYVCWFPFISLYNVYLFLCIFVHVMNHRHLYTHCVRGFSQWVNQFVSRVQMQEEPRQASTDSNKHTHILQQANKVYIEEVLGSKVTRCPLLSLPSPLHLTLQQECWKYPVMDANLNISLIPSPFLCSSDHLSSFLLVQMKMDIDSQLFMD